jgi:hypothetical protein
VDGHDAVFAIADEDLERGDESKTSAVHFLRWNITDAMVKSLRDGARLIIGIDHTEYEASTEIIDATHQSLVGDFA